MRRVQPAVSLIVAAAIVVAAPAAQAAQSATPATTPATPATTRPAKAAKPATARTATPATPTTPVDPTLGVTPVGWSETFTPEAMGSYVGDKKPNVMVVGASATSEEAAAALRGALRTSKMAGLVIDAQAIGSTEGLDDRTIVERAKVQPVGLIVIVRVFEGGPGEPPSAIVTFYRPDGTVSTAITGTAGTAIAGSGGALASVGVTDEAATAVSDVGDEAEKEAKEDKAKLARAQARYDEEYLYFQNYLGVSAQTGAVVASWSTIKQGKYGVDVRGSELYRIVGRDDLVQAYKRRQGVRFGVGLPATLGGLALLGVGTGVLLSNVLADPPYFGDDDPLKMGRDTGVERVSNVGAGVMMGAGTLLFIGGLIFIGAYKPHPASKAEAAKMIEEYNKGLRKTLGLGDETARVNLSPMLGRSNGLAISGRF